MYETLFKKMDSPSAYEVYFISEVYEKDIYRRFPQWVDNFDREIRTLEEWDRWVGEKQFERGWKGSRNFWERN